MHILDLMVTFPQMSDDRGAHCQEEPRLLCRLQILSHDNDFVIMYATEAPDRGRQATETETEIETESETETEIETETETKTET